MSKGEKIVVWALGVLNVLFLVYWFGLSVNYRMHYDDVHFMADLQTMSIWEFIKTRYFDVGGNFATYFENGIVDKISLLIGDYRLWPLIYYGLGIWMTYAVAKYYLKSIHSVMLFMAVVTIYNIYVLTSIDLAVFTWLCAMAYYLFGPMLFVLISYLNRERLEWWRWGILCAIAFYIAGASVSFSPVALSVMFANGMWIWRQHGWNVKQTWDDVRIKRIVGIAAVMVILLAIMVVAPGNYSRLEGTGENFQTPTSILAFIIAVGKACVSFGYFMAFYLPYQLLLLAVGCVLGMQSKMVLSKTKKRMIISVIIAFFVYLVLSTLPSAYLYGGFGIYRPYTHTCFMYNMLFAAIGYILGMGLEKCRIASASTLCLSVMMIGIMCININMDYPIMQRYAKVHDERKVYLLQLKAEGNEDTVCVERYPSSASIDTKYMVMKLFGRKSPKQALYYEADTSTKPNPYMGYVQDYLDLDFDFVICE